jgi:catechol 2,3-dioxygenase-like lactoylglutathione lyase family enzyme
MLSHVHVGITDFARSYGFYRAVLGELELELKIYRPEQSWAAWAAPGGEQVRRVGAALLW